MATSPLRRASGVALCILACASTGALSAQQPGEPQVTPVDVQPSLRNAEQAGRVLEVVHPRTLRAAGIDGVVVLWLHVDALGRVTDTRLKESSGFVAYDDAAGEVARAMTFTPARRGNEPVPAWITMNIRFPGNAAAGASTTEPQPAPGAAVATRPAAAPGRATPAGAGAASAAVAPDPVQEKPLSAEPTFTPMTVAPTLRNAGEVQVALRALYPPLLRDTGIGGTVNVWLFIDETGAVANTRVNESSGYEEMDATALQVARRMRFTPAMNRDQRVPVWVAIDINFAVTP